MTDEINRIALRKGLAPSEDDLSFLLNTSTLIIGVIRPNAWKWYLGCFEPLMTYDRLC